MLTKRKKVIGLCLLFGILLCTVGCVGIKMLTPQVQRYPQGPQRSIFITIDTSHRQEFFDQLQNFADNHNFKILIDTRSSGNEYFLIDMTREDIEILGANDFALGEYQFGFYHADLLHPTPESIFDDLVNDLQKFINEIPNATFTVEK